MHSQSIDIAALHKGLVELIGEESAVRSLPHVGLYDARGHVAAGPPILLGALGRGQGQVGVLAAA